MQRGHYKQGFTIVELVIVIVVIAILAAISIVAYNGIQQRARDTQRKSDVATLTKALELYYTDNGSYPSCYGSTSINAGWCTTADASWPTLSTALANYLPKVPRDPISQAMGAGQYPWDDSGNGRYNYSYVATSDYCGITPSSQPPQLYILVYRLESSPQENRLIGSCATNSVGPYPGSNYRVVK